MSQRQIAALICKSFGIYALLNGLANAPALLLPLLSQLVGQRSGGAAWFFWGTIVNSLPFLVWMIAGIVLWNQAETIAKSMVPEGETIAPRSWGVEARALVFSAIGLWTVINTLPRFGMVAIKILTFARQDPLIRLDYSGMTLPEIGALLIQFGVGCWLLFAARGLVQSLGLGGDAVEVTGEESEVGRDKPIL